MTARPLSLMKILSLRIKFSYHNFVIPTALTVVVANLIMSPCVENLLFTFTNNLLSPTKSTNISIKSLVPSDFNCFSHQVCLNTDQPTSLTYKGTSVSVS